MRGDDVIKVLKLYGGTINNIVRRSEAHIRDSGVLALVVGLNRIMGDDLKKTSNCIEVIGSVYDSNYF